MKLRKKPKKEMSSLCISGYLELIKRSFEIGTKIYVIAPRTILTVFFKNSGQANFVQSFLKNNNVILPDSRKTAEFRESGKLPHPRAKVFEIKEVEPVEIRGEQTVTVKTELKPIKMYADYADAYEALLKVCNIADGHLFILKLNQKLGKIIRARKRREAFKSFLRGNKIIVPDEELTKQAWESGDLKTQEKVFEVKKVRYEIIERPAPKPKPQVKETAKEEPTPQTRKSRKRRRARKATARKKTVAVFVSEPVAEPMRSEKPIKPVEDKTAMERMKAEFKETMQKELDVFDAFMTSTQLIPWLFDKDGNILPKQELEENRAKINAAFGLFIDIPFLGTFLQLKQIKT